MKKKKGALLFVIFLVQILIFVPNILSEIQNNDDLEIVLSSELETNSEEIHSNLMPIGMYSFWDVPELDIGSFSHDITSINIKELQYPTFNTTGISNLNFSSSGNQTGNTTEGMSEYTTSANFDTIIRINANFSANYTAYDQDIYQHDVIFNDDINSGYWDLYGVLQRYFTVEASLTGDSCVDWSFGNTNYGSEPVIWAQEGSGQRAYIYFSWDSSSEDGIGGYLSDNQTGVGSPDLYIRINNAGSGGKQYYLYHTTSFDEGTITWNNQPGATDLVNEFSITSTGWKTLELGDNFDYYVIQSKSSSNYLAVYTKESSEVPHILCYKVKNYYGSGYMYMQTSTTETLSLKSPIYSDTTCLIGDYLRIQFKTTTSKEVKLKMLNNGVEVNQIVILESGNTDYNVQTVNIDINKSVTFDQLVITGEFDNTKYFKCYDIEIRRPTLISDLWVENFDYSILGLNYSESLELVLENYTINETDCRKGSIEYKFDSTMLSHYNHTSDLTIYAQNLTFIFNISFSMDINFSLYISYSSNEWKVPTEVNLRINGIDVVDSTYNSGFVSLNIFPTSLIITADVLVYFKLNISIGFTFTFNLDIVSKTYLHQTFSLLSDHKITIETIDFNDNLKLKKVYMNSIEYMASDPCTINIDMETGNTFYLDVILSESIYQPLTQVMNNLGLGNYRAYISGTTNTLSYNDYTRFNDFSFTLPSNFDLNNANLSFSDIRYKPNYISNDSYNTFNSYEESQSWIDETITIENSTTESELYNISYQAQVPSNDSFTMYNGTHTANGTLGLLDYDSSAFNSTEAGHYPATYSFEGESGDTGTNSWIDSDTSGSGCSISVIDYLDGHSEVCYFQDGSSSTSFTGIDNFDSQSYGTFEFWIRVTAIDKYIQIRPMDSSSNPQIPIAIRVNAWYYYDAGWHAIPNVANPVVNTWIHFRYDFETTGGGYLGLSQNKCDITINGTSSGEITIGAYQLAKLQISSDNALTGFSTYIDAVGYSWESYNVGTNLIPNEPTLNFTITEQLTQTNGIIEGLNITYGFNTTSYQIVNFYIWDFTNTQWYLIESCESYCDISLKNWTIINYAYEQIDFVNSTKHFILNIVATNYTTEFTLNLDYLVIETKLANGSTYRFCPSLNIVFKNPVFVSEAFNITTNAIQTSNYSIANITFWDNVSNTVQSIGNSEGQYNITLNFTSSTYYDISVFCNDSSGAWIRINVSNLFVRKMACFIDVLNLKSYYDHNQTISFNASLRDCSNTPLNNQIINYSLTNQSDSIINQSTLTTNALGDAIFYFESDYTHLGFFHINFSFYSNIYLNYSKLMSFELLPIQRSVNSTDVNLQVNSNNVINNAIQINGTSSISINSLDNTTFDLSISIFIEYNQSFSYSDYLSYTFTFSASTDLTRITIINANLSNIPINFTNYYFDSLSSSNYVLSGTNLEISEAIGEIYYNSNSFSVQLRYYTNSVRRVQLTSNPITSVNSVSFTEYYLTNSSFSYWYLVNSYTINGLELYHTRTGTSIEYSEFTKEGSFYYFEESSLQNDQFTGTIDYNPNWDISYSVISDTGTYAKLKIDYKADLEISNVNMLIDTSTYNLYAENWTCSATQSSTTFIIDIPNVNFTTSYQTLYLEGYSSIPHFTYYKYESDTNYNRINMDTEVDYAFYLNFTKYTQTFDYIKDSSDTIYSMYYGNKNYSVQTISNTEIRVVGTGFDPSVNDSYFHVRTKPFTLVNFEYENDTITISIDCKYNTTNVYFAYPFQPSGAHDLSTNNESIEGLSDLEISGYLTFTMDELPVGTTVLIINVNFATPLEMFLQALLIFGVGGGFIGVYYYLKRSESAQSKLREWGKKIQEKLSRKRKEKGFDKIELSVKGDKMYLKKTD